MRTHARIILWLVIVALSSIYGFLAGQSSGEPFDLRIRISGALFCGGIGFTIATICLALGAYTVAEVRDGLQTKVMGILFVLFWSVLIAVIPPVALEFSGLFIGEGAIATVAEAVITVGIALFEFVAFAIAILCVRQK